MINNKKANQSNHSLVFNKSIQPLAGFQQINPIIGWFSTNQSNH